MHTSAPPNLVCRQPNRPNNPHIQRLAFNVRTQLAAKCKPQVGDVLLPARLVRVGALKAGHVHTHQRRGFEVVRGLFQCFSGTTVGQALAGVEVAGWVVEPQAVAGIFFNQQKFLNAAKVFCNHGRYGHAGFEVSNHKSRLAVWKEPFSV